MPAIASLVVETWSQPLTPAEVLTRLPRASGRFVLDSQGGPPEISRYSLVGHEPFLRFESRGRQLTMWEEGKARYEVGDPLEALEALLRRYAAEAAPGVPFAGGAAGYLAYDLGRQIERLPDTARDDLPAVPDIWMCFYDHFLVIDHLSGTASAVAVPFARREAEAVAGARRLAQLARMADPLRPAAQPRTPQAGSELTSNFTREAYCQVVERALEHIADGHIYQVNLAQRFSAPWTGGAEALYLRLRAANPAPFAAFLDAGDFKVVSASPERFLLFDPATRRVETRPIKGTRPRGSTHAEDERLTAELLASAKDEAELVMIVDLERSDLGRVCEFGSVRVADLRRVEAYPTVLHTVATVEGRLREDAGLADLLRATFPGGSITGAPKIRAMQIIEELEGLRRHVYCGAIGYLGFDGRIDLNIAIRTILLKDGHAYFHAGGGIVADSDPAGEYEETLHKARALAEAVGAGVKGNW